MFTLPYVCLANKSILTYCRRATGGDADRLGGAVEQLALHHRAAGGVRAARAAAARAARQLIARAARALERARLARTRCSAPTLVGPRARTRVRTGPIFARICSAQTIQVHSA